MPFLLITVNMQLIQIDKSRAKDAARASAVHFVVSFLVAVVVGIVIFVIWYPYPYGEMAAGRELFILVMLVDVVCGPLLTFVLYTPTKPKRELATDLGMVVVLQLAALAYGMWMVWQVRPLYLVYEFDRFKVITSVEIDNSSLSNLPNELKPQFFSGPKLVGLRVPTSKEQELVLMESVQGGKDYGERPEFYVKYEGAVAYKKAHELDKFRNKYSGSTNQLDKVVRQTGVDEKQLRYLPIIAREDWIVILNPSGSLLAFVPGDGF